MEFPKGSQNTRHITPHSSYKYDSAIGVGKQGKDEGEIWSPSSFAIDKNTSQIFIAEGSSHAPRISIFTQTGKFVESYTHEQLKYPRGIAVYRDNVYVTDKIQNAVLHFIMDKDLSFVGSVGEWGSGREEFDDPRQIAVSTSGELFVADRGNDRIQILNSELEYLREISHDSMTHPCDVKITENQIYVLSDTDANSVHVFSHSGEKLRSLITLGAGKQVTRTNFFDVDANGNFIISDFSAHQIRIFSKEGSLLHKIGGLGHEVGRFYLPRGVAITNNSDLVVLSENINYRLQIFSPLKEENVVDQ